MKRLRYASEFDDSGYAVAAARCLGALRRIDVDLAWEPLVDSHQGRVIDPTGAPQAPAWLRSLRRLRQPPEAVVIHSVPTAWAGVVASLQAAHTIGHSVWETDRIPQRWRHEMSVVDEFWVPTHWNQAVFADTFDRPVHVVPHVASEAIPTAPPLVLNDDHFVVAVVSAWDWRKRPDLAVRAFCDAFSGDDPVTMVLKTTARPIAWWDLAPVRIQVEAILAEYRNPPTVLVETGRFDEGQMLGLLQRADCVFSMTSAEGWGLGPFDAACLGTPVIITGFGGQVEWLGGDYPGLLPFRMVDADHPDRSLFEPGMTWAAADADTAVDQLRALYEGRHPALTERSASLAGELTRRYAPGAVADIVEAVLPSALRRDRTAVGSLRQRRPTDHESVVIMTPVKNAARHADRWCELILSLDHPRALTSVAVLVSDSDDGSAECFEAALQRLVEHGITTRLVRRDFGVATPDGLQRWEPAIQVQRRTVLALSRNHLLFAGLADQAWVLWIDADVVDYPADIVDQLISIARHSGADIVHPDCVVEPGGPSFDHNAWTDHGRFHLDDYRGLPAVELHATGATMLLVRADRHRDGLVWPAFPYGLANARVRTDPATIGRPGVGELESEGLAIMAADMGILCLGVPNVQIRHADE
jgi:glycosyltransferase involved in cell wall biosynthesis